jgi:hypothetical protein
MCLCRIEGDPLGAERALEALPNRGAIRSLEILVQYDPWRQTFGAIPEQFLSRECNHVGSLELFMHGIQTGRAVVLPCRHRFNFDWSFLQGYQNLEKLNLQGLSGDMDHVIDLLADILISSPHLTEFGLADSTSGFAAGLLFSLLKLRRTIAKRDPGFVQDVMLRNVLDATVGSGYIPDVWNEWDSLHPSGDLGWALDRLFPHNVDFGGVAKLTVHNTELRVQTQSENTEFVRVTGIPMPMVDNPWRNYEPGLRGGLLHFQVDVLTVSLCQLIVAAAGNEAFLPGNHSEDDVFGFNSVVQRPDGSSFLLEWRFIDTTGDESALTNYSSSDLWHYWRLE